MVLPSVSSRAFGLSITAASIIRWTFCSVLSVARNGSCLQNSYDTIICCNIGQLRSRIKKPLLVGSDP
jgi:hypothetical protein